MQTHDYEIGEEIIEVHYDVDPEEPGFPGSFNVYKMYINIKQHQGKRVKIDVFDFLVNSGLMTLEELEEEILGELKG
tara:strand:- start:91 stop:321 length:231 start_codon:yes stop_codon:yes gene_type:complete